MSVKVKCAHCKHRLAKKICGHPESPHHNQQIDMSNSCDFFEHNPAQPLYSEALAKGVVGVGDENVEAEMLEDLETAIKLRLPEDDESYARFTLGDHYWRRAYRQSRGDIDIPDFSRGVEEMEKAVLMDSQGEYGVFSEPIRKAQLCSLAAAYLAVKDSIWQQKGIDPAVAYLEDKLHLFDYLSSPPLLLLQGLGELYVEKDDTELARQTFTRILQTSTSPGDGEHEANVREGARQQLQALDSPDTKRSGCFIATAVYGSDECPEVETLRYFRDKFLVKRPLGKLFVSFYYAFSPSVAKLLERSQASRKLVIRFLLRPVLTMVKHTIRKTNKSSRTLLEEDSVRRLDAPISEMRVDRKGG